MFFCDQSNTFDYFLFNILIHYEMKLLNISVLVFCLAGMVACSSGPKQEEDKVEEQVQSAPATAMALLSSASGSSVQGKATFEQVNDNTVRMTLEVENLSAGDHALHLHEIGDCSAPDATSAGGHWNPTGMDHGKRGEGQYHVGDVINLLAGEDGKVTWSDEVSGWTIGGEEASNILGRAVVIHDKPDDFVSQPSGAAGARVACGVITQQ